MSPYGCALEGRQPGYSKPPYGHEGAERTFRGTATANGPATALAYNVAPASSPEPRSFEGGSYVCARSARLWRPAAPEILSGGFAIAFRCPGPDAYFRRRFAPRLSVPMRMTPPAPRCRKMRSRREHAVFQRGPQRRESSHYWAARQSGLCLSIEFEQKLQRKSSASSLYHCSQMNGK